MSADDSVGNAVSMEVGNAYSSGDPSMGCT